MPTTEPKPCVWAVDLVKRLEESGTPAHKLQRVKEAMVKRWESTAKLPDSDPERHLSAAEALDILTTQYGITHGTVERARELFETGILAPPRPTVDPVALIPEPPRDKTPADFVASENASGPANDGKTPGVVDLSAAIPTIGPKPVQKASAKPTKTPKPAKYKPAKGKGVKELLGVTPPAGSQPETTPASTESPEG